MKRIGAGQMGVIEMKPGKATVSCFMPWSLKIKPIPNNPDCHDWGLQAVIKKYELLIAMLLKERSYIAPSLITLWMIVDVD